MILFVYRTDDEPHVWYFVLEEVNEVKSLLDLVCMDLAAKDKTSRIVYEPFKGHDSANQYYSRIAANGDRIVKSNQELLQLKKAS